MEIEINESPQAAARPLAKRPELSEEAREEIRKAFELFDSANTGLVEKRELKLMMRALGYVPRKEQLSRMLLTSGISPRANQIRYEEFLTLMAQIINEKDIQEEMMKAFTLFDVDNAGKITLENLRTVAEQLGEKMTDLELEEMIREADLDKDGAVNANEFIRIMKKTDLW